MDDIYNTDNEDDNIGEVDKQHKVLRTESPISEGTGSTDTKMPESYVVSESPESTQDGVFDSEDECQLRSTRPRSRKKKKRNLVLDEASASDDDGSDPVKKLSNT